MCRRQYWFQPGEGLIKSAEMKKCWPVLNVANGVTVEEVNLPIWKEHLNTLLNRQAPSFPELEHVQRSMCTVVGEETPTVWKSMLSFLELEAASDSPHKGRLFNALRNDGILEEFIRSIKDMKRRITAAA
ncbi:hypothetical protein RB195_014116 [Necator americanus]|uniref:Uncharacterized protein n=1 Tax=Necator americanus TaxID=51031 RepID=A0ABR1DYU1_NECAM